MSLERPNLDVGEPPGRLKKLRGQGISKPIVVLILLQCATLTWLVYFVSVLDTGQTAIGDTGQHIRETAIALEKRSLYAEAAQAWTKLIELDSTSASDPELLFRIGKLWMDADNFSAALPHLIRAEVLLGEDETELSRKIGERIVQCLEQKGMYGEVGRELSRQVGLGGESTGKGEVLATMDGHQITEADLDQLIEQRVDQIFALRGAKPSTEDRNKLVAQLRGQRERLLMELLRQELFARRARELKLDKKTNFKSALKLFTQTYLGQEFQKAELAKIVPTDVDLESFYEANKLRYSEPASATVVEWRSSSGQSATDALARISNAEDFEKLVREQNKLKDDQPLPTKELVKGANAGVGIDGVFKLTAGQWTKTPVQYGTTQVLYLVKNATPASVRPLEEVRERVRQEYLARKHGEIAQKLFSELSHRYRVEILAEPEAKNDK